APARPRPALSSAAAALVPGCPSGPSPGPSRCSAKPPLLWEAESAIYQCVTLLHPNLALGLRRSVFGPDFLCPNTERLRPNAEHLPHLTQHFAADVHLARVAVRNHASARGKDCQSHSVQHLRQLIRMRINSQPGFADPADL